MEILHQPLSYLKQTHKIVQVLTLIAGTLVTATNKAVGYPSITHMSKLARMLLLLLSQTLLIKLQLTLDKSLFDQQQLSRH